MAMAQVNPAPMEQKGPSKLERALQIMGLVTDIASTGANIYGMKKPPGLGGVPGVGSASIPASVQTGTSVLGPDYARRLGAFRSYLGGP